MKDLLYIIQIFDILQRFMGILQYLQRSLEMLWNSPGFLNSFLRNYRSYDSSRSLFFKDYFQILKCTLKSFFFSLKIFQEDYLWFASSFIIFGSSAILDFKINDENPNMKLLDWNNVVSDLQ